METPSPFRTRSFIVAILSTSRVMLKLSMESPMLFNVDSKSMRVSEVGSRRIIRSCFNSDKVTMARLARGCRMDITHTR